MNVLDLIKPSHDDSKKSKLVQKLILTVLAVGLVISVASELGWVRTSFSAESLKRVDPQSAEIGKTICGEFADGSPLTLESVQVLAGLADFNGYDTDTVICTFKGGQTIPWMLFYRDGVFVDYQ